MASKRALNADTVWPHVAQVACRFCGRHLGTAWADTEEGMRAEAQWLVDAHFAERHNDGTGA